MTAIPFPAIISAAAISIAVIDPPIITYMRSPITGIPSIDPTCIPPITRRP
jgi:hypothetical protein